MGVPRVLDCPVNDHWKRLMSVTIAIAGCLDTKGEETAYLLDVIKAAGSGAWVIDTGVLGPPAFEANTPREAVAEAGGSSLEELIVLCLGGPISEPSDAQCILQNTSAIDGFFGASSIERLATEPAIRDQAAAFKQITF